MISRDLSIVCLSVTLGACAQGIDVVTAPGSLDDPAYAIYSVVLDSLYGNNNMRADSPTFVVYDSAESFVISGRAGYLLKEVGPLYKTRVAAMIADIPTTIPQRIEGSRFKVAGDVAVVTRESLRSLPGGMRDGRILYWDAFYERYPKSVGTFSFSIPIFDATRHFALISYAHSCGTLCADGGWVLLENAHGRWLVRKRVISWMS